MEADRNLRTLTIHDNGIGMSRDEVIANIGTIAKSGTRELVDRMKKGESQQSIAELIGQFGRRLLLLVHGRRPRRAGDPPRR